MKKLIGDFCEGDRLEKAFLIKEKRLMDFRNKPGRYLHLVIEDRSGEMEAKVWENCEAFSDQCLAGKVSILTGEVVSYRESLQFRVTNARFPASGEVDINEFIVSSVRSAAEMSLELQALVRGMKPGPMRNIGMAFLEAEWYERFCQAPAAQAYHHNYAGGLLEHTLGVANLVRQIAGVYQEIDEDLLVLGAILHDIGKVKEMRFIPGIQYTDEGKLLGHIIMGIQMAEELMRPLKGIDPELKTRVLHLIASHHGEYEWGSPRRPKFLEARILHLADQMDADVFKFKSAHPAEIGSNWSPYMRTLGYQVYLGGKNHATGGGGSESGEGQDR